MAPQTDAPTQPRIPLSRERVLEAAVALADEGGIEAVSMRKLGQQLGVEAMSLYNHVANKEDLLDGMVDNVLEEVDFSEGGSDWKSAMRHQMMSARQVMIRHPWAPKVIETRTTMSAPMMQYMDRIIGNFIEGGLSIELTHHAMHALGSRILGFSQEMFDDSEAMEQDPQVAAVMMQQMAAAYPNISALISQINHDEAEIIGSGCDDNLEFVFAVDLILDGLERLRDSA
jgi:AcrR family transcriptional regulator